MSDLDATLVVKSVEEHRFTLAPAYIPHRYDAHNEWTDPLHLQKGTWSFVRSGRRQINLQHTTRPAGEWVEIVSWPVEVTLPMTLPDQISKARDVTFPPGTTFLGVIWEPWSWDLVKKGKLRGFSVGGFARRIEAEFDKTALKKSAAFDLDAEMAIAEALSKYVKKVGDRYCVFSHQTGKKFGCYSTREEAEALLEHISRFAKYLARKRSPEEHGATEHTATDWIKSYRAGHITFDELGSRLESHPETFEEVMTAYAEGLLDRPEYRRIEMAVDRAVRSRVA